MRTWGKIRRASECLTTYVDLLIAKRDEVYLALHPPQVNDPRYEIVRKTYGEMYKNQTMDTVKSRVRG